MTQCDHANCTWEDCYNCEEGYSDHDCGEDTCCCLNPEPNVVCDVCDGKGGWWKCDRCGKCGDDVQKAGEQQAKAEDECFEKEFSEKDKEFFAIMRHNK